MSWFVAALFAGITLSACLGHSIKGTDTTIKGMKDKILKGSPTITTKGKQDVMTCQDVRFCKGVCNGQWTEDTSRTCPKLGNSNHKCCSKQPKVSEEVTTCRGFGKHCKKSCNEVKGEIETEDICQTPGKGKHNGHDNKKCCIRRSTELCSGKELDLAFVVEEPVMTSDFKHMKNFLKMVTARFDIGKGKGKSSVSVLMLSDIPRIQLKPGSHQTNDRKSLFKAIHDIKKSNRIKHPFLTSTVEHNTDILTRLTNGHSNNKVVVLVTESPSNLYLGWARAASLLKITLIIVGTREYTRPNKYRNVFAFNNFHNLEYLATSVSNAVCNEISKQPALPEDAVPEPDFPVALPAPECKNKKIDMAFLIDESSSINSENFETVKTLVADFIEKCDVGSDKTQIGVVTYSSDPRPHMWLDQGIALEKLAGMMKEILKDFGDTYTHKALEYLPKFMCNGRRDDAPKVVVMVTDGKSANPELTKQAAAQVKATGMILIVVVVNDKGYNQDEVYGIATSPAHVFHVTKYRDLHSVADDVRKAVCLVPSTAIMSCDTLAPIDTSSCGISCPTSCQDICIGVDLGAVEPNKKYEIDCDGPQYGADPFYVECDCADKVNAVTVVPNTEAAEYCFSNCIETTESGECVKVKTVDYAPSIYQMASLIHSMSSCTQFVQFRGKNTTLTYDAVNGDRRMRSWWRNMKGEEMDYMPGGDKYGCKCGRTRTCDDRKTDCNNNMEDDDWHVDGGDLADKANLPVIEFGVGGINQPGQEGCFTIGALRCV